MFDLRWTLLLLVQLLTCNGGIFIVRDVSDLLDGWKKSQVNKDTQPTFIIQNDLVSRTNLELVNSLDLLNVSITGAGVQMNNIGLDISGPLGHGMSIFFSGITFSGTFNGSALFFRNTNVHFTGCIFQNITVPHRLDAAQSDILHVSDTLFQYISGPAIYIGGSSSLFLSNTNFTSTGSVSRWAWKNHIDAITIHRCHFINCGGPVLDIPTFTSTGHAIITDSTFHHLASISIVIGGRIRQHISTTNCLFSHGRDSVITVYTIGDDAVWNFSNNVIQEYHIEFVGLVQSNLASKGAHVTMMNNIITNSTSTNHMFEISKREGNPDAILEQFLFTGNTFDGCSASSALYLSSLKVYDELIVSGNRFYNGVGRLYFDELQRPFDGQADKNNVSVIIRDNIWENVTSPGPGAALYSTSHMSKIYLSNNIFHRVTSLRDGGAVYVDRMSDLHVTDCIFTENSALGNGGALLFTHKWYNFNNTSVYLNNCTFRGNQARNSGAAIYVEGPCIQDVVLMDLIIEGNVGADQGAVTVSSAVANVTIYNVTFTSNRAQTGLGGALLLYNSLSDRFTMSHCRFTDNWAVYGGSLYIIGKVKEVILDHLQLASTAGVSGGGIAVKTAQIESFSLSESVLSGDALFNGGLLYISDCYVRQLDVISSVISGDVTLRGGSIFVENSRLNVTLSDVTLSNSKAYMGGGIYIDGMSQSVWNVRDSRFEYNAAQTGGGAIYNEGEGEFNLKSVIFRGNGSPTCRGGALSSVTPHGNVSISHCTFSDNRGGLGGALCVISSNLTVVDSQFTDNRAWSVWGGAIHVENITSVHLQRVTLSRNTAINGGGLSSLASRIFLEDSEVSDNTAIDTTHTAGEQNGGGIHADSSQLTVRNVKFTRNFAWSLGGGAYLRGTLTDVTNGQWMDNSAHAQGGSIYFDLHDVSKKRESPHGLEISRNSFVHGTSVKGGALSIYNERGKEYVKITDSQMTNNQAQYGAAIHLYGSAQIEGCTIYNNTASEVNSSQIQLGRTLYSSSSGEVGGHDNNVELHSVYVSPDTLLVMYGDFNLSLLDCGPDLAASKRPEGFTCVTKPEESDVTKRWWIGLVIGISVLFLLCGSITYYIVRRRRSAEEERLRLEIEREMSNTYVSDLMLYGITVEDRIGGGNFGDVYRGVWSDTVVAIKRANLKVEDGRWGQEIVLLKKLNHPNIVRFFGVMNHQGQFMMVMEYMPNGSLDSYLKSHHMEFNDNDLVSLTFDVVKGMLYLQSKGVIHRDLAARNVLVDVNRRAKLSDFGMSRERKEDDIYSATSTQIPYRWTAPEAIQYGTCSFESDVWSFGVVVWETFSFGRVPYYSMTTREAVQYVVEEKGKLDRPPRCPQEMYEILVECCHFDPANRPSFKSIYDRMKREYSVLSTQGIDLQLSPSVTPVRVSHREYEYEERSRHSGLRTSVYNTTSSDPLLEGENEWIPGTHIGQLVTGW
ncbi:tyrosine-protein kinase Fer-like isoform 1 [Planoprotostelium fungivorum]|uniref:Tyrosine-protein kinase Fer-like isoform 1 n=1 Tax=Planoprotostelium fungivorum TaxID=1890364 RepID=A0A2P6NAF1_9EUKA|nr:tyrosine-protein kinase Fer-like isoform 1 [Planoprotostelium fungivorum]